MLRPAQRQTGVTLAEMVVVVAIVAIMAAIVLPKADPVSPAVADAAAGEVARALRFAQREARRTGSYYRVELSPTAQTLRVYRLTGSNPPREDSASITLHPVDKQRYDMNFSANPNSRTQLVSSVFRYENGATTAYVSFAPDGSPVDTPKNLILNFFGIKDIDPLAEDGKVILRHGNAERVVRVAPLTGRVTF